MKIIRNSIFSKGIWDKFRGGYLGSVEISPPGGIYPKCTPTNHAIASRVPTTRNISVTMETVIFISTKHLMSNLGEILKELVNHI